jgi:hypothetical protein
MATSPKIEISNTLSRNLAVIGVRMLDDAHMTWVAAEVESGHALRAWFEGAPSRRTAAFVTYRAAVDREEAAARDLQRLFELTRPYQDRLAQSG